jgi:Tetratricopeptide repeat
MYLVLVVAAWCALFAPPAFAGQQYSYTRDVAPIVRAHCASCHRPGGAAPFSLLTFDDVRSRARLIADVTSKRAMPPWKPTAGGPFVGDRSLPAEHIETLARWAAAGAPRGADDEGSASAPPHAPALETWQLGNPDLVVALAEPYMLPAAGDDEFRNFVIGLPISGTRFVAGVEVRVDGSRAVHHANLRIDSTDWSRRLDAEDRLPGYEGAVSPNARYPDGYFLGWTPGQTPARAAPGMAWRLRPGVDLVMQLHLRKTGEVEAVQPRVAFYFTNEAPVRQPLALRLGRQNLDIAPETVYVARDSYTLPVGVEVHAIHPHAHYRATNVLVTALLPDGGSLTLIHISDWDFNWQDVYRYREPVWLPAGTTIQTEFTYDNSVRNPRNPDRPARRVLFGQNSPDEMGDLWLQVLPRSAADRALLYQDVYPKTVAEDVAGYEMVLRGNPDHAGYRRDLANGYYNLGTLYLTRNRFAEAAAAFRSALEMRPGHSATHNNLGVALKALKQLDAAIQEFERALALDPANAGAQQNLTAALALKKQ